MYQQHLSNSLESNQIFRIIKSTLLESSLIIQLKILRYTSKQSIKNDNEILKNLIKEIKIDSTNHINILNMNLIINFFNYTKINQNSELKTSFMLFKKYDEDKLLVKSHDEFLTLCNFIESFFYNLEKVDLKDLQYLQAKLLTFKNSEFLKTYSLFDKYFNKLRRHQEIRYMLFFEYYEILINYLIIVKGKKANFINNYNINNNDLCGKIQNFICLISDIKESLKINYFDLLSLMEHNVRLINPMLMPEKEKILCYENLLTDFLGNPNLKESQLVISFYLSDSYYKQNNYEKAIEVILPMIKLLKEEIFIEENPFATKIEIHDYLMLLCSRIINSSYFLNNSEIVLKFIKKLTKYFMLLKKSKKIDQENPEIQSIIKRYECMVSIFLNLLNLEMVGRTKIKKEIINNSYYLNKNQNKDNADNKIINNSKLICYDNIISFLDQFKSNDFLPMEKPKQNLYNYPLENKSLTLDEIHSLDFDKLLNHFMCNFAKQLMISNDSTENNKVCMSKTNREFLKSIKLFLDDKLLKLEFGIDLDQKKFQINNIYNKNFNYHITTLEKYFQLIIGYYNLMFFFHNLLIHEKTDQRRKNNYFSNLNGLCETFHYFFTKIFSPVLTTIQQNDQNNFYSTPGGDNYPINPQVNPNTSILKMLVENSKIKHLLLKIFFIHINSFKYEQKYEEGLKQYDIYELLLLNFDLNDDISQSLYFSLMKLKADHLIRSRNYIYGLNVYFEILRVLDSKNDNFIEDRAIVLFNTGFAYLFKMRNYISQNPNNKSEVKEDIRSIKNYFQDALNLFETIKYNREKSNVNLSNLFLF